MEKTDKIISLINHTNFVILGNGIILTFFTVYSLLNSVSNTISCFTVFSKLYLPVKINLICVCLHVSVNTIIELRWNSESIILRRAKKLLMTIFAISSKTTPTILIKPLYRLIFNIKIFKFIFSWSKGKKSFFHQ